MGEHFIDGSVEITSFKKLIDALEKHNELMEKQNEILSEISIVLKLDL